MGDKGGKKDKEKNKATAVDETERRRAEEARQSAGQEALCRLGVRPDSELLREKIVDRGIDLQICLPPARGLRAYSGFESRDARQKPFCLWRAFILSRIAKTLYFSSAKYGK